MFPTMVILGNLLYDTSGKNCAGDMLTSVRNVWTGKDFLEEDDPEIRHLHQG